MEVIVEETDNSIALDIDFNESIIFWTDGAKEEIRRYIYIYIYVAHIYITPDMREHPH